MYRQPAWVRLNESDQLRIVTMIAGHGIEVHLDAVAGSDHHIASFGGHRGTFRELKKAGTPLSEVPVVVTCRRWWRCP